MDLGRWRGGGIWENLREVRPYTTLEYYIYIIFSIKNKAEETLILKHLYNSSLLRNMLYFNVIRHQHAVRSQCLNDNGCLAITAGWGFEKMDRDRVVVWTDKTIQFWSVPNSQGHISQGGNNIVQLMNMVLLFPIYNEGLWGLASFRVAQDHTALAHLDLWTPTRDLHSFYLYGQVWDYCWRWSRILQLW